MCRVYSQIFWWCHHISIQIIVLAACLQKTGGFACNWPLTHAKLAYNWRPIVGTICMRLAATRLQDKRQADKWCVKGCLYIIIIFFSFSPHPQPCFWLFSWRPLDIWFGKCAGTMDDKATRKHILPALAASCSQSRQFFASTLWEQLFEYKNEDAIKKSNNLRNACP